MVNNKSLCLFYGKEDFLVDEEVRKLKDELAPRLMGGMNLEVVDGQSASTDQIINALAATPLLGGEKMVIIKNTAQLKSSGSKRGGKAKAEVKDDGDNQLHKVLENLSDGVHAVFVVHGDVDRRKKLFKVIDANGEAREFKPFAEWEEEKLLSWIVNRARLCGKKIGSHAARVLADVSGSNLRFLSLEIDKLATYVGERDLIEEKDIAAVASAGTLSAFALINSLRDRDLKGSLESLARLMRDREDPVSLLGLIAKQFRVLLQVKSLQERAMSENEIAATLGVNHYFVKKTADKTFRFSIDELKNSLRVLHEADLKLKRTSSSPQAILELAIIDICSKTKKMNAAYADQ